MIAAAVIGAVAAVVGGIAHLDVRRIRRRESLFPVFDEWRREQERP